jgi:hypothetical protein
MAGIQKFSEQVIDVAERLADVADAAQGKGVRKGGVRARWLILPAAGAGLYALATNGSLPRQAKVVLQQAKARASDLPEELFDRVQQASGLDNGQKSTRQPARKSTSRKSGRQSSRKTSSTR